MSHQRFGIMDVLHYLSGQVFQAFHTKSRSEIKDAISILRPFLTDDEVGRIEALWREYDQIPQQELDNKYEIDSTVEWDRTDPKAKTPPKPSKRLLHYLDEFARIAK